MKSYACTSAASLAGIILWTVGSTEGFKVGKFITSSNWLY